MSGWGVRVQTFLRYPDLVAGCQVLDSAPLGTQRVDTFQILRAPTWPAPLLWTLHELAAHPGEPEFVRDDAEALRVSIPSDLGGALRRAVLRATAVELRKVRRYIDEVDMDRLRRDQAADRRG